MTVAGRNAEALRRLVPRPALTLLAALVLGFGVTSGHHPARCHGVYRVALVCNADAAAPTRAKRFAAALLARWNGVIGTHGFPADLAGCAPDGEALYACEWRIYSVREKRYRCRAAVLSTSFMEFKAAWVPCAGAFNPTVKPDAA